MLFSEQQEQAISSIVNWHKNSSNQIFRLFGYAGTGKTTIAKYIAEQVGGNVLFAAFTGKAAEVLRQKGCPNTSTIHSLIYTPKEASRKRLKELEVALTQLKASPNPDPRRIQDIQKLIDAEKENSKKPLFSLNLESVLKDANLLIVDEVSMVDQYIGQDLLSFGTKILVLGDPAQLPPIRGSGFFTDGHKPDFMLTEIHRQAKDNPIIYLATEVRNGRRPPIGKYGNSEIKLFKDYDTKELLNTDQLLVGRNATRGKYNRLIRSMLGRTDNLPISGDKIVCLRNNNERGLLNGSIWTVDEVTQYELDDQKVMFSAYRDEYTKANPIGVNAHLHYFLGNGDTLDWWEKKEAEEFDYGYALTVHKAQGSQWDYVTLFDESKCFTKDVDRWLYTAITRAADKLIWVK